MDLEDNNGNCVDKLQTLESKVLSSRIKATRLKKWKRISRDFNQDGGTNVENTKIVKGGLSDSRKQFSSTSTIERNDAVKGDLGNSGKKFRGEQVKIEKENSHSSLESDSRSSKFVFMMQGRQVEMGKSSNFDEADSGQIGFKKDNLSADFNGDVVEETCVTNGLSADLDPLAGVIVKLEEEIKKFREIQKEDNCIIDSSDCTSVSESELINLEQNVNILEIKLEEANAMLNMKEVQLIELESTLNNSISPQELQQLKFKEMENEVETLFMLKLEAEIEYLAVSKTIPQLRYPVMDPTTLLEERKTLASEQTHILKKLQSAENEAVLLKGQAEELETSCGEILKREEEELKLFKFTTLFFIQLLLLLVVLGLFWLQFSPREVVDIVPT